MKTHEICPHHHTTKLEVYLDLKITLYKKDTKTSGNTQVSSTGWFNPYNVDNEC